jgi:hypothetical protein
MDTEVRKDWELSSTYKHAQHLNVDMSKNKDEIMTHFSLTFIASFEVDMSLSSARLDKLEIDSMEK